MAGTAPLLSSKDIVVNWGENALEFLGTFSGLPATTENTSYEVETNERSFTKNTPNQKYADYDIDVFFDNTVRDSLITDKEAGTSKVLKFESKVTGATWTKSYNAQVKNVGSPSGDVAEGQPGFTATFTINGPVSAD